MFNSIIPKLYEMCQNDEFKGIKALQFDDLKIAYEYLNVFEKQHNISTADHNRFETDVLCEFTQTSQQIGFICGFKVAVRLMSEIYGITK